jgi:hypothetical protein
MDERRHRLMPDWSRVPSALRNADTTERSRPPPRPALTRSSSYCTLALTEALPVTVNRHVFTLLPPLEQAPDQIAPRPLETVSVTDVPVVNVAEPELPTATLIPTGLEVTRSPVLPVAVTVTVAD